MLTMVIKMEGEPAMSSCFKMIMTLQRILEGWLLYLNVKQNNKLGLTSQKMNLVHCKTKI